MSIYFGQNLPKPSSEEVVEIGGRECFPQADFFPRVVPHRPDLSLLPQTEYQSVLSRACLI